MAWFDKHLWSRRKAEEERKALAASVEEMAARGELSDEDWDAELEDGAPAGKTAIIPPLLRLQSRVWPVMRVDDASGPRGVRGQLPQTTGTQVPARAKRLGRSTKVHLQAVRVDQEREPTTERVHSLDGSARTQETERTVQSLEVQRPEQPGTARGEKILPALSQPLNGSGMIEQGQEEVTVSCAQVSERSVVTVMLAGNPGPVVVQYITLHPDVGFTFHLSAPVIASTPFNYLFWPC